MFINNLFPVSIFLRNAGHFFPHSYVRYFEVEPYRHMSFILLPQDFLAKKKAWLEKTKELHPNSRRQSTLLMHSVHALWKWVLLLSQWNLAKISITWHWVNQCPTQYSLLTSAALLLHLTEPTNHKQTDIVNVMWKKTVTCLVCLDMEPDHMIKRQQPQNSHVIWSHGFSFIPRDYQCTEFSTRIPFADIARVL